MAIFGNLYLNNGTWDDEQIIPVDWVARSTETHITRLGYRYGYEYQWWTFPSGEVYFKTGAWG